MTKLQRATAKRMMWEARWRAEGMRFSGAAWLAYRKWSEREIDLVVEGIDKREAARKL